MTDIPIIDSHVHLWDPSRLCYAWHEDVPSLAQPFLLEDYHDATEELSIERMIFMQCDCLPSQSRAEVNMALEWSEKDPRLQGIVAFAPLEQGCLVEEELSWLASFQQIKGVRRITQDELDPAFVNTRQFVQGVELLGQYNLVCDLCIKPSQLANITSLVKQCPEVRFVLDHLGKPDIKSGIRDLWWGEIKKFASFPNTWCKLSGVVTEADHETWTDEQVMPVIQHAIECFGPERLLYGGDWPVVTLACSYARWAQTVCRAIRSLTWHEQKMILHDVAAKVYQLGPCL